MKALLPLLFFVPGMFPFTQDQPAPPPALATPRVVLVTPPPPLPPAFDAERKAAGSTSGLAGIMQIKIAGAVLPVVGSCCFCPDGSEKPAQWSAQKKAAETKANPDEKR